MHPRLTPVLLNFALFASVSAAASQALGQTTTAPADDDGPTLVTLQGGRLSDVLRDLAQQGHCTIDDDGRDLISQRQAALSIDVKEQPFWEAFRQICNQARLEPTESFHVPPLPGDSPGLWSHRGLLPGKVLLQEGQDAPNQVPVCVSGAFYVEAAAARFNIPPRDVQKYHHGPQCTLNLECWAEPKLRPIAWSIDSVEAADDRGQALKPAWVLDRTASMWAEAGDIGMTFNAAAAPGTKIARLKGHSRVTILKKSLVWEIANVMTAGRSSRVIGGAQIDLAPLAREQPGKYRLSAEIHRGNQSDQEWKQTQLLLDCARPQLLDAKGRSLDSGVGTMKLVLGGKDDHYSYWDDFGQTMFVEHKVDPPEKMIWELPVETKQNDLPFEFHDIKLGS